MYSYASICFFFRQVIFDAKASNGRLPNVMIACGELRDALFLEEFASTAAATGLC